MYNKFIICIYYLLTHVFNIMMGEILGFYTSSNLLVALEVGYNTLPPGDFSWEHQSTINTMFLSFNIKMYYKADCFNTYI